MGRGKQKRRIIQVQQISGVRNISGVVNKKWQQINQELYVNAVRWVHSTSVKQNKNSPASEVTFKRSYHKRTHQIRCVDRIVQKNCVQLFKSLYGDTKALLEIHKTTTQIQIQLFITIITLLSLLMNHFFSMYFYLYLHFCFLLFKFTIIHLTQY